MTRNLIFFLLLSLVGCTSRPGQTVVNPTVKSDTISNKTEVKKQTERLFDFYYSFAYDKKFQMERIKFPLTIEEFDKKYQIKKSDWKQDSLFTKLEYITFIYNSHSQTFEYDKDNGDKAIFSWIYPLKGEQKDYYFIRETGKWYLLKVSTHSFDNSTPEAFITFLQKFMSDSAFQIRRIKFPLETIFLEEAEDGEYKGKTENINLKDWKFGSLYDNAKSITNFSDSWNSKINEKDKMLLFIGGVENGINIKYFFTKIDEKWYLTKMFDESM